MHALGLRKIHVDGRRLLLSQESSKWLKCILHDMRHYEAGLRHVHASRVGLRSKSELVA
jgi:hypothetical protein